MSLTQSLNETPDARIVRVLEKDDSSAVVQVTTDLPKAVYDSVSHRMQYLELDLRSSLARLGFDGELIGDVTISGSRSLSADMRISEAIPDLMPKGGFDPEWFHEGLYVGKFAVRDPHQLLGADKLMEYLEKGWIRVSEPGVVPNGELAIGPQGGLLLPIDPVEFRQNPAVYTVDAVQDILDRRQARTAIDRYTMAVAVDQVVVPTGGGVVTKTNLARHVDDGGTHLGLEAWVMDVDDTVKHSSARMASHHGKRGLHLEFSSTAEEDTPLQHVEVQLYQPEVQKTQIQVPIVRSNEPNDTLSRIDTLVDSYNHDHRPNPDEINFSVFGSGGMPRRYVYQRNDFEGHQAFVQENLGGKFSLLANQFPGVGADPRNNGVASQLDMLAKSGSLENIFLTHGSAGLYFSQQAVNQIEDWSNAGAQIFWQHPESGNWMVYYDGMFVKPEKVHQYETNMLCGNTVVVYGSAASVSPSGADLLRKTIDEIAEINGGHLTVYTGGNAKQDSTMNIVNNIAREKGYLTAAVVWNVEGENAVAGDFDAIMPFGRYDLLHRQRVMVERAEAAVFSEQYGAGTLLEQFYEAVMTNPKIGLKPVFLLGNTWDPVLELMAAKNQHDPPLISNVVLGRFESVIRSPGQANQVVYHAYGLAPRPR